MTGLRADLEAQVAPGHGLDREWPVDAAPASFDAVAATHGTLSFHACLPLL